MREIHNLVVPTGILVVMDNVDADIVPMSEDLVVPTCIWDARGTQNAVTPAAEICVTYQFS